MNMIGQGSTDIILSLERLDKDGGTDLIPSTDLANATITVTP